MAALTCDICGGQLTMDSSGEYAICESCGMKHTKDRVKAKALEITGTVKIDDTDAVKTQISNWEKMAMAAFDNSNYDEAYTYYCKMLEKQVDNWMPTFRKGLCLGWQSTLANIRFNEVLGSVADATKLLFNDETQSDSLRANGKMIMAVEVFNWIQAVSNLVVEQANEYAGQLVNSAKEFYARECLVSQLMLFNMAMLDEFTYENYEDKDTFINLSNGMINAARTTVNNMNSSFRIKTGSEWNSFWSTYEDVWENVTPDYQTINTRNELSSAINELSSNVNNWKQNYNRKQIEKEKKEKEERIARFWESNPDKYQEYCKNLEIEKNELEKKKKADQAVEEAQNKLRPLSDQYSQLGNSIRNNQLQMEKLEKKIFGKKKAQEDIISINYEIEQLKHSMNEMEPSKKQAEDIVNTMKKNAELINSNYVKAHTVVVDMLKTYNLD